MEIKAIKSYEHEIFNIRPDIGGDFTISRIEDRLTGSVTYDVNDNSKIIFSKIHPENPVWRTLVNAVEFRRGNRDWNPI
jgi:hypothetical protein